jgi:Flp pilus assembly protein TadG
VTIRRAITRRDDGQHRGVRQGGVRQRGWWRQARRDQRGQSLIEFAVASTVFFMTMFGTLEFGLAVWHYNMVSNLAQEGARWASVRGSTSTLNPKATWGDLQAYVQSRAAGMTVTVVPTGAEPSTLGLGQPATVMVQNTFTIAGGLLPGGSLVLQSTAQMIMAR